MTDTVIVTEDSDEPTETVADAVETAADAVETAADAVETAADAIEDAGDNGEIIDAVLVTEALSIEQRVTRLEERADSYATRDELDSVRSAAYRAEDLALDAAADAEAATDPGEVEAMIEGTEITEDEEGNPVLDAPADVPPPGSGQHILFADGKEVRSRFTNWLAGKK